MEAILQFLINLTVIISVPLVCFLMVALMIYLVADVFKDAIETYRKIRSKY